MQFDVLGPLRVVGAQGTPVNMSSVAQRRLMSILVLRAGTVVAADSLSEHLELSWGALRTSVSRLRRIVGFDILVTAPPGYELRSDNIDARRFEQLVADARTAADPVGAREMLEEALALWRGDAYGEFAHEGWASAEARRLAELRAGAMEDLAERFIEAGEWSAAIATAESLIDAEPYRDRPRGLLMRALTGSGRRTDALRAFQTYRVLLLDEVGTEPSEELADLDREIARGSDVAEHLPGVFLMTDIVGSTRLWAESPDAMSLDLAVHDDLLSRAITEHGGVTISKGGDSFAAAFDRSHDAVAAAVAVHDRLAATTWHVPDGIRVRMGVHLGEAQRRGDGWYGPPLNETARMTAVAHGGQIVVSEPVAALVSDVPFVDLGEHRLRDLDGTHRIFQVALPGATEFPALRSMGRYETTLPAQRTALIGRDDLVADIRGLLVDHRLVSLIGPGGVGKTRLVVEAAGQELGNFPGGVFFVDLTTAANDDEVLGAVISGVRTSVPPEVSPEEHLHAHFGDRRALLVVDNCEHVVDRAAAVVDGLLRAAPDVRVLATSREALDLHGESRVLVPSLDVDGTASPAVRLFTERALAVDDGSITGETDLDAVAEITRRLDGIPLAVELAAAQIRALTPAQILVHLDDRFRLLRRGNRQAPPRQRTLEATVAWSYELLDHDEQRAFRWLAVCAGPFTLGTAGRLLGVDELKAAQLLDSLVGKSLVVLVRFGGQSQGYRYLETLRDYGRRRLGDARELDDAQMALEAALLPPAELLDDWVALVNLYICANDVNIVIEDATRRAAAAHALAAGRLDAAALIFSSCTFRDDPGALDITLQLVAPLAHRRDDLDPTAWCAVGIAKVDLERLTRRFTACFTTAVDMLAALDADDPARDWFDMWRCALTTAVAPEAGVAELDNVLPVARDHARAPHDYTLSALLANKATGLAIMRRLDEAASTIDEALVWVPVGKESRDQLLALRLWISYLTGSPPDQELLDEVAAQNQELGIAELCAAPGALCGDGSVEARAVELVARARRRPSTDVPTPFLLAFAWLAIEDGDRARAVELVAKSELYDSSTHVALTSILSTLHGWTDATWAADRDAAVRRYLSPEHAPMAEQGAAALAAEVDDWERRLSGRDASVETSARK